MKDHIENILNREMTRKEFLQHVGSGMLVLFGITSLIKAITGQSNKGTIKQQGAAYGSSVYGGIENAS